MIFSFSPLLFFTFSLFVVPLQIYGSIKGKVVLEDSFFSFWIWANLLILLLIIFVRTISQPEELHFQKVLFEMLKSDDLFESMLEITVMNVLFGLTGRMISKGRAYLFLHTLISFVNLLLMVELFLK